MRFLLDQNVSPQTLLFLKSLGIDVLDVRGVGLKGKDDDLIYEYALQHKLVIITYDHEFDYKYVSRKDLDGLILLRVHPQTLEILHPILKKFFDTVDIKKIEKCIVVIERHRCRMRKVE